MNFPVTEIQLVDLSPDKLTHKPFNPLGPRPYHHLLSGRLLALQVFLFCFVFIFRILFPFLNQPSHSQFLIPQQRPPSLVLPMELEVGKTIQTRAAEIGFETRETQKLIIRVWQNIAQEDGEGAGVKKQLRTFVLGLGVTGAQVVEIARRRLGTEEVSC